MCLELSLSVSYLEFLNWFFYSFEERLAAQRREREAAAAAAELGFKKPLSKEEKIMKKKERLAAIGNIPGVIVWMPLDLCFILFNQWKAYDNKWLLIWPYVMK